MSDKKSPPEKQGGAWPNADQDDDHTRTYYGGGPGGGLEDEELIRPVEEEDPPPPKSQALMDIQEAGMTPEEAARASEEIAAGGGGEPEEKAKKKAAKGKSGSDDSDARSGKENLAVIARFRWTFLWVLSLISVAVWTAEAFISARPYNWEAAGWLALTLIASVATIKFLRLPTRGGLAALFWAGSYFISALYGPAEHWFGDIPAALGWAGLLTLIVLWMGVAIWRKLGRYRVIDLVLSLVLIYAAFAPVGALVGSITSGAALQMNFADLGQSPVFLTRHLPWFIWPMTVFVAVILPLCAFFSLWDQFSAFRRRGARHGGNFFLALAFIVLIPYAFLSYDRAATELPQLAVDIRSICPEAIECVRETPVSDSGPIGADGADVPAPSAPVTPEAQEAPADHLAVVPPASPSPSAQAPEASTPAARAPEAEPGPAVTAPAPEKAVPAEIAPPGQPSPASPQEGIEAPAEADLAPPTTLEQRLLATDQRLDEALARIEELEQEIKTLKAPPSGPEAEPQADEPAPNEIIENHMESDLEPSQRL